MRKFLTICVAATAALLLAKSAPAQTLKMNELGYFEARGTNVLVYNNLYNGGFYDEKFAGMEIIQRGMTRSSRAWKSSSAASASPPAAASA